jgi:hypothetical protein
MTRNVLRRFDRDHKEEPHTGTKKEPCGGGPTAPVQLVQQVSGAISHRYFQKLKATDLRQVTRRYESKVKLMFYFETSLVRISGMTGAPKKEAAIEGGLGRPERVVSDASTIPISC